jgi:flavin reductase (DIM6/NTAB) family NADH-FMN oxidoreductase RutF
MEKKSVGARTLVYPTPVFLVGTYDSDGRPNIMTAAWSGICCSRPPCIAVSLRAATHSHAAIGQRKAFTISVPSAAQVREADYAGIYSGRDEDKFEALGLTPVRSDLIDAPFVDEAPLVLECALRHVHELGLHTQFVGEILDVKADPATLDEEGLPDIARVDPLIYATGSKSYHRVGERVAPAFTVGRKPASP